MYNRNRKSHKKAVLLTVIILIIVAAAAYTGVAYLKSYWPFLPHQSTTSTSHPASDNNSDVKNTTNQPSASSQDKTQVQSTPPASDNSSSQSSGGSSSSSSNNTLTGIITHAGAADGTLTIRTTITQFLSSGTCKLTLKNSATGSATTYSAAIVANPSSSTCNGFNISTKNLSNGNYDISIDLTSGDQTGTITGQVTI